MTRTDYLHKQGLLTQPARLNVDARIRFALPQFRNFLHGLPLLKGTAPLNQIHGQFCRVPAIIIGAGPSLEKNIHLLKEARSRAILIAVDSIYDRLLSEGIVPHMMATTDQQEITVNKIKTEPHADTALLYAPGAHPGVVERFERRFMGFYADDFQLAVARWFGLMRAPEMQTTSVSQFAFECAYKMGCSPLILVGQDLAVTETASHAEGATHRTPPDKIAERFTGWCPGNLEEKVRTDAIFLIQQAAYRDFQKRTGCIAYNASAGGAEIDGFHSYPLDVAFSGGGVLIDPSISLGFDGVSLLKKDPVAQLRRFHANGAPIRVKRSLQEGMSSTGGLLSSIMLPTHLEKEYAESQGEIPKLKDEHYWVSDFINKDISVVGKGGPDVWRAWLKERRDELSPLGKVWLEAVRGNETLK